MENRESGLFRGQVDEKRPTRRFECLTIHVSDMPTTRPSGFGPDRRPGQSRWRLLRQRNGRNLNTTLTDAPRVLVLENLGLRGEYTPATM